MTSYQTIVELALPVDIIDTDGTVTTDIAATVVSGDGNPVGETPDLGVDGMGPNVTGTELDQNAVNAAGYVA